MPRQQDPDRFDTTMRAITTPAVLILIALPLAALWNAITWSTAGKLAATTAIVWVGCSIIAALICRPRG